MAEVLQAIDLPLVYADLSQPETLKDALYSIKRLSDAVDLIFDKIDRKVSVERQRQTSINQRYSAKPPCCAKTRNNHSY